MKNISGFLSENFQFLEVNFSIYLNRRVFVTVFREEGAGCFALLWFVACELSVMVCLLFLLMSLVGYVL